MKHITVKYNYGFFDLDWNHSIATKIIHDRKLFSLKWFLEIYQDNRLVKVIECETEDYAYKLEKKLKEDIENNAYVSFLI